MSNSNFLVWNPSKPTIGSLATQLLRLGHDPKSIPDKVRKVFPTSNIKVNSVYWYASQAGIKLSSSTKEFNAEALKALVG